MSDTSDLNDDFYFEFEKAPKVGTKDYEAFDVFDDPNMTPEQINAELVHAHKMAEEAGYITTITGTAPDATLVVSDDAWKRAEEAAQADAVAAAQAATLSPVESPLQSPAGAGGQPPGIAPDGPTDAFPDNGNGSSSDANTGERHPPKPTDLEHVLAKIHDSGERQNRLVMVGNPGIEARFYARMSELGRLHVHGGQRTLRASDAFAEKVLREVVESTPGASMHLVAQVTSLRTGSGLGAVTAEIKNLLGRENRADVWVVGTPEQVDKQMKEIGKHFEKMELRGFVRDSNGNGKLTNEDGSLNRREVKSTEGQPTRYEPLQIRTSGGFSDFLALAQETVANRRHFIEERKEMRDAGEDVKDAGKDASKDAGKDGAKGGKDATTDAKSAAGQAQAEKPNGHAGRVAGEVASALASTAAVQATNDKNQTAGIAALNRASVFKDPETREIATLPAAQRQTMLAQLSALATKFDDKELGTRGTDAFDKLKAGETRTPREKLTAWLAEEHKNDPQFADKAREVMAELVKNGVITESQAERTLETVVRAAAAPASEQHTAAEATSTATASAATAEATAGTAATSTASTSAGNTAAAGVTEGGTESHVANGVQSAQSGAGQATETASAQTTTQTTESVSETAGPSAAVLDKDTGSQTATPALGEAAGSRSESGSTGESTIDPAGTSSGRSFRDRLNDMLEHSDGELTPLQAQHVMNELAVRRDEPLSSLAAGEGAGPSTTLRNVRTILRNASNGEYGDALAEQSRELRGAVNEWNKQDDERAATAARRASARGDGAATAEQSPLTAVHDAAQRSVDERASAASTRPDTRDAAGGTQTGAATSSRASAASGQASLQFEAGEVNRADTSSATGRAAGVSAGDSSTRSASGTGAAARSTQGESSMTAPSAESVARTDEHARTLARMMDNPARTFTTRDKNWNQTNIEKAAQAVAGLDLKAVAERPANERTTLAAYSAWLADAAKSGKLPGFSSDAGKALATAVSEKAAALATMADGALPASTHREVTKATRMVGAMDERMTRAAQSETVASMSSRENFGSTGNAKGLAQDLVHAMYKQNEVPADYANYLLKNASQLTPSALKGLPVETQAKTAAALSYLAAQVREGAMGDFDSLSPSVKRNVHTAQQTAANLDASIASDPKNAATLAGAYIELNTRPEAGSTASNSSVNTAGVSQDAQTGGTASTVSTGQEAQQGSSGKTGQTQEAVSGRSEGGIQSATLGDRQSGSEAGRESRTASGQDAAMGSERADERDANRMADDVHSSKARRGAELER